MTKGWEGRAVRSWVRRQWSGVNRMTMFYRDGGCRAWDVDGIAHGGYLVAVTDPAKCRLNLFGIPELYTTTSGTVALSLFVYEEDVAWAYLINDNSFLAVLVSKMEAKLWGRDKARDPNLILQHAKESEAGWPRR